MKAQTNYNPLSTFNYQNNSINYHVIGTGTQNILFINGYGLSLHSWDLIKTRFDSSKYTLIFFDLLGTGYSSKPKQFDYSLDQHAKSIHKLLEHLQIKETHIIGHSYGGLLTLYIHYLCEYENYGLKINKTILVDAPGYNRYIPGFIKLFKVPVVGSIGLGLYPNKWLAKKVIKLTFYDKKTALNKHNDRYNFAFSHKDYKQAWIIQAKNLVPKHVVEIEKSYRNIESEILMIWGKNDSFVDQKHAHDLLNDLPNAKLIFIPNCGHVPQEERPKETYLLINKFLEK